ncbi:MAG: DinB family protein [Ignavibacteria bacterium]|nr:DinB family protein [Ignavibacteria bacterium]
MSKQIELLKWMLEDVRKVTLYGVEHLSKEHLFESPSDSEKEYPVGSYLMHLAECDIFWLEVLSGIDQSDELKKRCYYNSWYDPSEIPDFPESPIEFSVYQSVIDEARKNFLNYLSEMEDSQLDEEVSIKGDTSGKKFKKKWIIYHILEHEAHHRGQMFMLLRQAGWNKI